MSRNENVSRRGLRRRAQLETQHLFEKLAVPRWQCTVKFRLKGLLRVARSALRVWSQPPRGEPGARRLELEQSHHSLVVDTDGPGFTDLTGSVSAWLQSARARDGLLTLFIRHTSASLTIQENADPDVLRDLADALERTAPRGGRYRHGMEGPDDMPAHIKAMLTATSLGVPVMGGRMLLGTWQAIYLIEHRDRPHRREIALHYLGTCG
jgi:secondary thiamine-phosphate synthase enzyme